MQGVAMHFTLPHAFLRFMGKGGAQRRIGVCRHQAKTQKLYSLNGLTIAGIRKLEITPRSCVRK